MLKIERKAVEFVEKKLFLICVLFLSLLALYLRRIAVWWNYDAIGSYFDMHENYTQTATYFLIVRLVQYLPLLPAHSIKYLAALSDFGVAAMTTYLLGKNADDRKRLIFYTVCLFSPVLFLRGVIWAQLDSVAILFLLIGYALYSVRKKIGKGGARWFALLSAAVSIALCPHLFLVVLLYLWKNEGKQRDFWCDLLVLTGVGLAIQFASALLIGASWKEGVLSGVRFLTYHPESGALYENGEEWLLQMVYLYSPVGTVLTALATGRHKLSYGWAALTQIVAAVLYGANLFVALP